jgi:hypothetical protein
MTTWKTLRLDQQTATPLTVTTDWKENKKRKPTLRRFFVFCHYTTSKFAKPHKPTHNPIFAKSLAFARAQWSVDN